MLRIAKLSLCWVLLNISAASASPSASLPSSVNKPFERSADGLYADEVVIEDVSDMSQLTEVVTPVPPPSQGTLINLGCILAANSGFLNGLALSGLLADRQQAVAAVTGAYTTSALAAAEGKVGFLLLQFKVIAAYFGGSLLNGLMNPKGIEWSKKPNALAVAASLVFAGALDYVATERFFVLLALALGLQNSWTSMLIKGNVLRTAHISGMTSDMGTILGQVLRGNTVEAWKFSIFARLAASFWTGGFLSILASKKYTEISFLGSVGLYLALWTMLSVRGTTKPVVVEQPSPVDVSLNVTVDDTSTLVKKDL